MKKSIEEHADRFDEAAAEYDNEGSDEYEAAVELVVAHARRGLSGSETVLDLGAGTGAVALRLADGAGRVVGRDVSEGMLDRGREKAAERGIENASFGEGTFREPNYGGTVDVVVSNFAMHHLSDAEKREVVSVLDDLDPDRVVLGDVTFFGEPDPEATFYDPEVDDPATVGVLVDAFTDDGFVVSAVERIHDQVGVIVADRPAVVPELTAGGNRVGAADEESGDG
ncbi:MAG: class I SAM-dependent methyltransferase [Halobacteriales archaeon]